MLQSLKSISGNRLQSGDQVFGEVIDFLFDDRDWRVRYVVANTRRLIPGRKVVIPLGKVGRPGGDGFLPVTLTKDEIKAGLSLRDAGSETALPTAELHSRFDWFPGRSGDIPPASLAPGMSPREGGGVPPRRDYHLCSARDTGAYSVESIDGETGGLEDFVYEGESWVIRYLVVAPDGNMSRGRVYVPTDRIRTVRHLEGRILTGVWRDPIIGSPGTSSPEPDHRKPQREISHHPLFDFNGRTRFWL